MRLMEGRDITWDDLANNRNVVIINQTVARRLWPGQTQLDVQRLRAGQRRR